MYIPKHSHFFISTGISLLGFYIKHKLGDTYDVVIVFLAIQYHAIMHTLYIFIAGKMYQAYVTKMDSKYVHEKPREEDIINWNTGEKIKDLNTSDVVYTQAVTLPKFDMERQFAKTLLVMHDHEPDDKSVNLTETRWIRPNKFKSRAEFKAMLEVWEGHGLIRRKSEKKNAPYTVRDWRAVELVADGNPLPPLVRN